MEGKKPLRVRLCDLSGAVIAVWTWIIFVFLTVISLIQTCHVDIGFSETNDEHVSHLFDNIPLNLLVLAILLLLTFALVRRKIAKRTAYLTFAGMMVISTAIGMWWIFSAKAGLAGDSQQIVDRATHILIGEGDVVRDAFYFHLYPFQLGYLLFAENVLRVFGSTNYMSLAVINVICVDLAYLAVFCIAKRLFKDERVWLLTGVYAGLCIQPMFLATFLYGTLPGMALALWATYLVIVSMQKEKTWLLLPAAVLLALAITVKKNYLIVLIADSLMLLVHALRVKKPLPVIGVAVMVALSLAAPGWVQKSYEERLGADFGRGVPQMAWLVTGFTESSLCCGWYNSYTNNVLPENGYDYDRALAQCKRDLTAQLKMFSGRPRYFFSFMFYKITSQWNEPAYQSIWSSASSWHTGPISPFVESLGTGAASDALNNYFNQLMQYIYFGFTVALFLLFNRKNRTDERMILPLVILGAALYHALFEAKSQYAIIYVPMMLPYAAFSMTLMADRAAGWLRLRKKATSESQGK